MSLSPPRVPLALSGSSAATVLATIALAATTSVAACGSEGSETPAGSNGFPDAEAGAAIPPSCTPAAIEGLAIAGGDLNGYPPYAVDACTLVYVDAAGALVLRDLTTGGTTEIAPASDRAFRPALSAGLVAWESRAEETTAIRVRRRGLSGLDATFTLRGPFVAASEPRVHGQSVVFTAAPRAGETDLDVYLYEDSNDSHDTSRDVRPIFEGPGQQRFADVDETFVVATDFAEDPDGVSNDDGHDLADIVVFDRRSATKTTRHLPGKQAFPILASGSIFGYLDWAAIHPEPKLTSFDLRAGVALGDVGRDWLVTHVDHGALAYARPAATRDTFEWIAAAEHGALLGRARALPNETPIVALQGDGQLLYAPAPNRAAGSAFTILAAQSATPGPNGAPIVLRVVPR